LIKHSHKWEAVKVVLAGREGRAASEADKQDPVDNVEADKVGLAELVGKEDLVGKAVGQTHKWRPRSKKS